MTFLSEVDAAESYGAEIKPYLDGQLAGEVTRSHGGALRNHVAQDPRKRCAAVLQAIWQATIRESDEVHLSVIGANGHQQVD